MGTFLIYWKYYAVLKVHFLSRNNSRDKLFLVASTIEDELIYWKYYAVLKVHFLSSNNSRDKLFWVTSNIEDFIHKYIFILYNLIQKWRKQAPFYSAIGNGILCLEAHFWDKQF